VISLSDVWSNLGDISANKLKECYHCNGYGSSLKEEQERCSVCDGVGLIREEKKHEKVEKKY